MAEAYLPCTPRQWCLAQPLSAHPVAHFRPTQKMAVSLEDVGVVDASPRVFGRQMIMTIGPKTKESVSVKSK